MISSLLHNCCLLWRLVTCFVRWQVWLVWCLNIDNRKAFLDLFKLKVVFHTWRSVGYKSHIKEMPRIFCVWSLNCYLHRFLWNTWHLRWSYFLDSPNIKSAVFGSNFMTSLLFLPFLFFAWQMFISFIFPGLFSRPIHMAGLYEARV